MNIPDNHQRVMAYLILKDAAGFASFLESIFDGKLISAHMREDGKTIMHGEAKIDDSTIMFAESTDQYMVQTSHFFVYVDDADATHQKIIDAGGKQVTEVSDQPYGRSGGVSDPYGNTWWVTTV